MKIKKYLFIIIVCFTIFAFNQSKAENFFYDIGDGNTIEDNTKIGEILSEEGVKPQNSLINRLREAFKLSNGIYAKSDNKATDYIKNIINMVLSLVSLIALVMLIYGFYLMFFSKEEEGFTKAKKILQGVIIAIIIMGLSFFIVNFIFYLYKNVGANNNTVSITQININKTIS